METTALPTTDFSTTIGTVTYQSFPTYDALNHLRTDVIKGMMAFLRLIGLGSLEQINVALGCPPEDNRAEWMLTRTGLVRKITEEQAEENRKTTIEIQKSVLGDDDYPYVVDVIEIATMLQRPDYLSNCQKALRALLKQKQDERLKPEEPAEVQATPKTQPKSDEVESQVKAIAEKCFLSPTVTFRQAKETEGYFQRLLSDFPHISVEMIVAYLFFGQVKRASVLKALKDCGASRSRGFRVKPDSLIERSAFVAWTGGDWRKYYESGGEIEIVPPNEEKKRGPKLKAPRLPKKPKASTKKVPAAQVVAKPEKVRQVANQPDSQAIITICGPHRQLRDLIDSIESNSAIRLIEYTVKK